MVQNSLRWSKLWKKVQFYAYNVIEKNWPRHVTYSSDCLYGLLPSDGNFLVGLTGNLDTTQDTTETLIG